jgi:hypothetical protein
MAHSIIDRKAEFNSLLTAFEVSELLRIAPRTLENWRKNRRSNRRRGPAYVKIGRRVRYLRGDILNFIEEHRIEVNAPPRKV